ncbi:MAG: hypothetical protein AMJ69_02750 [Gammaproteobacteria bacterium SG8_47]|nr:MAG: hypothetical protein AMJ69_02750 [Gammaproteobacteria bacterium SG8_47]
MKASRERSDFFPWSGPINLQSYLDELNIAPEDVQEVEWSTRADGHHLMTVRMRDGSTISLKREAKAS